MPPGEQRHLFVPGFRANRVQFGEGRADATLQGPDGVLVGFLRETQEQIRKNIRDKFEHVGGAVFHQLAGARRKHQKRDRQGDRTTQRHFEDAIRGGRERRRMCESWGQNDDHGGGRSRGESGAHRGEQSERSYGDRQDRGKRGVA
jgi:hypothetical protein